MRRLSLIFALIAIACCFFADLEISSANTYTELKKIGHGLITPDFNTVWLHRDTIGTTLTFAISGTLLGIIAGFIFSFFYDRKPVKMILSFVRSIHEIFWVMLLMTPLGLNDVSGILGIAIPYSGIFAKVYHEIIQESNETVPNAVSPNTGNIARFLFTVFPGVLAEMKSYTSYRFECALRSSAVIGFVGFPTIGYHIDSYFNEGYYSETAALFLVFLVIIGSRKLWLNKYTMPVAIPIAIFFINWQAGFSMENIKRFLNDSIPFPIRKAINSGTEINWAEFSTWLQKICTNEMIPGLWNTLLLTQISLVCTGIFTLYTFPLGSNKFLGKLKFSGKGLFLFFRTIPEYVLAFILILPLGPSMLPGIITISIHNGAILSHLLANSADFIILKHDSAKSKINLYLYEVLPRVYGQFLAFLFYRWEIIMRESAILGVLGISTIGFYIDNALHEQRIDRVVLLIICTAILNIAIDAMSTKLRKKLKVSGKITSL